MTSFGSQDSAGRFALAPLGEFLKRDVPGSLHGAALFFDGETGTSSVQLFLECVKTGQSATHKLANGQGTFEWLQSDPELTKLFNAVMTSFAALRITGLLDLSGQQKGKGTLSARGSIGLCRAITAHNLAEKPGSFVQFFD